MKNQWLVYAIVAGISLVAGVAIAGTPNSVRNDATIVAPATTAVPATTTPPVDTPLATLVPVETTPEPVVTEVAVATTVAVTIAPETTTTTEPAPQRDEVVVVAVNGADTGGIAGRTRDELIDLGYGQARATDGTTIVDVTSIYFFEGFEREAELVALDLDVDPFRNKAVDEAPSFGQLGGDQVAVYIGRDRS